MYNRCVYYSNTNNLKKKYLEIVNLGVVISILHPSSAGEIVVLYYSRLCKVQNPQYIYIYINIYMTLKNNIRRRPASKIDNINFCISFKIRAWA